MIRAVGPTRPVLMEWDPTPEEKNVALAEQDEFRRNVTWFAAHAKEIRDQHPGRFVCIAAGQLYVGDDPNEVYGRARAAHPDIPGGFLTKRISHHRGPRVYAHRRLLGRG